MSGKREVSFSKNDSQALKGIAIFLLLCLHCFGRAWRFEGYDFVTYPFQVETFISLNEYCRICVSIFAFISGYGLYLAAKKKEEEGYPMSRWIVDRYFKTMKGYWFIYLFSIVVLSFAIKGYIQNQYFEKGKACALFYIVLDFLGVSEIFGTPSLNGSWWYMGAITTYIIMIPLIVKWVKKCGFVSLIGVVIIVPRVLLKNEFLGAANIYSFVLPAIVGAIFAENDLFSKFDRLKMTGKKWIDSIIIFAVLAVCIVVNIYIWLKVPYKQLWEYHFALVPVSVILFCYKYVISIPIFGKLLQFLGKHSMNIFLFHTFLRSRLIHDYIYRLKYPILTVLALLGVSLAVSIIVELLKKWVRWEKGINRIYQNIVKWL